jgi:hypothetical protein
MLPLTITLQNYRAFPTDAPIEFNLAGRGQNHTALEPFEPFGANKPKWDKSKNWLMFENMSRQDFSKTGLAEFIERTLTKLICPLDKTTRAKS